MNLNLYLLLFLNLCSISIEKRGGRGGGRGRSRGSRYGGSRSANLPSRPLRGNRISSGRGLTSEGLTTNDRSRAIATRIGGAAVGYASARMTMRLAKGSGNINLHEHGRIYYYGDHNYPNKSGDGIMICRYDINDDDHIFDLWFDNGERVTEIIYECNGKSEYCCNGLDCCDKLEMPWWSIALIVVIVFLILFGLVWRRRKYIA